MDKKQKLANLRKALYGVAVAVSAVLVMLGYVDGKQEGIYMLLVDALLGLAFVNVDTSEVSESSSDETGYWD